jgi:parallel beta-helix repeat protein
VTNLNDAGMGSLRQAILDTPAGGTVDFQPGLSGTITLMTGELAISKNLTVSGPGASVVTVSGNHASRVFDITGTFTVSIAGLTIADGSVGYPDIGGGIYNFGGTLTVTDSTLSGNTASSGGGIANSGAGGTLTVTGCTLSGNTAGIGGGILNVFTTQIGTLTVTDSTLSGNSATVGGGGIFNYGVLTVTDSTLSGNTGDEGGGIYNGIGTLTVTDSTLSGNSALAGGGIANDTGNPPATVTGCTLSGNSARDLGGGIYITGSGTWTITNTTLSGNTAGGEGSGIYNNGGTLAVGGLVTIDGDYFQGVYGTLDVRIGGTQAGTDYGQLVVNGFATLDGTLNVQLANGFVPQPGDPFQPLLFGSGSGTFAHYTGDVSGFSFLYVYDDGGFLPPGLTLVAN